MEESTPATPQEKKKPNYLLIGIIAAVVILLFGLIIRNSGDKNQAESVSSISGELNFNGLKPKDEPDKTASIKLMQKASGETQYSDTGVLIPVADNAKWEWTGAKSGVTYQLKADGYLGGKLIKSTNVITTTAPATGQILTFNITTSDLPEGFIPEPEVSVSGTIVINGYIPSGATVSIFGRPSGTENKYQAVIENIPAKNGVTWSYSKVEAGKTYDYQAEMYNSAGTFIGQSPYLTVTAPAANEVININSTAEAPSEKATISGNITLTGPVEQDSTVLILAKLSSETDFDDVQRVPARNGEAWSWTEASAGKTYDISAVLQVKGDNVSQGNVVAVAAPASNVNLKIDTKVSLVPPPTPSQAECQGPDSSGGYNAKILYPRVQGAKGYWVTVGTEPGRDDVYKKGSKHDDVRDAESITYIKPGQTQYARYSYTLCEDCDVYDTKNWSPYSPTLGFSCPRK